MSDDDLILIGLIDVIRDPRDNITEEEEDALVLRMKKLSPDPEPMKFFVDMKYADYTTQQIYDEMKAYKPIVL